MSAGGPHACEQLVYAVDEITLPLDFHVNGEDRYFAIAYLDQNDFVETISHCPFDGASLTDFSDSTLMPFGLAEPHRGQRIGKVLGLFDPPTGPRCHPPHGCPSLLEALQDDTLPVAYDGPFREFRLSYVAPDAPYPDPEDDGTGPWHLLQFCPFCGAELPTSVRDQWFGYFWSRDLDPNEDEVPVPMRSDEWWRETGL